METVLSISEKLSSIVEHKKTVMMDLKFKEVEQRKLNERVVVRGSFSRGETHALSEEPVLGKLEERGMVGFYDSFKDLLVRIINTCVHDLHYDELYIKVFYSRTPGNYKIRVSPISHDCYPFSLILAPLGNDCKIELITLAKDYGVYEHIEEVAKVDYLKLIPDPEAASSYKASVGEWMNHRFYE